MKLISFEKFVQLDEAAAAGKNTHMVHLEDAIIYGGVNGARDAINSLRAMRDVLAGNVDASHDVTVKWDGAPAVFAGIDPSDGKFFVAKKGIFNKDPKVYKSLEDVDADTSGDLAVKLKQAFTHLQKLNIKGVVQGDLMFTASDLKTETIDGVKYITFQPNTIVYAVPFDSEMGRKIKKASIGIVWHTRYTGKSFESMSASFNVHASEFGEHIAVWHQDARLHDLSGKVTFTKKDTQEITTLLSDAGKIFNSIASSTLKRISEEPLLAQTIETFNNTFVRDGKNPPPPKSHVKALIKWVEARFAKEMESRSSEKGKEAVDQKKKAFMAFFSPANKANLVQVFELQAKIVEAKKMVIAKLDKMKAMDTFVRTKDGFRVTSQEGFVAIDKTKSGAYKLVDRLEFSSNNFSPDILKGWH